MTPDRTHPRHRHGIRGLKQLLGSIEGQHRDHYVDAQVALHELVVLPQPRRTFEEIAELAHTIADEGLLKPLLVAQLSPDAFRRYLEVINHLRKTTLKADDFKPTSSDGLTVYRVLLAGERRYRACMFLWNEGCDDCRASASGQPLAPGACYLRHVGRSTVRATLYPEISPIHALLKQLDENTHKPVPDFEEAVAYQQMFQLMREADPAFTLTQFARRVGRSPDTIRRALQFCDLPEDVQASVERSHIRYGIAVEIARLQRLGSNADDLRWWRDRAIVSAARVPEFRAQITGAIAAKLSGQLDLLGLMSSEQERESRKLLIRSTVERQVINTLWWELRYLRRIVQLLNEGRLGRANSPFSKRSPRRVLREVIDQLDGVLAHTVQLLPSNEVDQAQRATGTLRQQLATLDALPEGEE